MSDRLDIAGEGRWAAEAVADRLRATDPQGADLLGAQIAFLKGGGASARDRAAALAAASGPHRPAYRSQFWLGELCPDNLTVLEHTWAWLYDDDIVSLVDGGLFEAKKHADPWEANVAAARALEGLAPYELRLCLFEGTEKIARVAAEQGLEGRVTHLELRPQREGVREAPLARTFSRLRGLCCDAPTAAALLREGAPELRALVVRHPASIDEVLSLAEGLPMLRHLGIWWGPNVTAAGWVDRLARHRVVEQLTSLELWTVNDATRFPFAEVRERAERFAGLFHLGLPEHLVPPATMASFDGWSGGEPGEGPALTFVSFDRREVLALDLETIGWAWTMR